MDKPCPEGYTTTTTTQDPSCVPPPICTELFDTHCVYYDGPDLDCIGIYQGDSLNDIINILLLELDGCCLPTTTTTSTTTTTTSTTTTTTACPNNFYLVCCGSLSGGFEDVEPIIIKPCSIPSQFTLATYQVYSDTTDGVGALSYTWIVATLTDIQQLGYSDVTSNYVPDWDLFTFVSNGEPTFYQAIIKCNPTGDSGVCPPPPPTTTTTSTSTTTTSTTTTTTTTIPPEEFIMNADGIETVCIRSLISTEAFDVDWGDGNVDSYTAGTYTNTISHTYSTPYTGEIKIISMNLTGITQFFTSDALGCTTTPDPSDITIDMTELTKLDGLKFFFSGFTVDGDIDLIPNSIDTFTTFNCNLTGNLSNLPSTIRDLGVFGANTINGNLSSLTANTTLQSIQVYGTNTISGLLSSLPINLTTIYIHGDNTIGGTIGSIPSGIKNVSIRGDNTITGDISGITSRSSMLLLDVYGDNTITGDAGNFPPNIVAVSLDGKRAFPDTSLPTSGNSIYGDIGDLPSSLKSFVLFGSTSIGGSLNILSITCPTLETFTVHGINGISGNISGLPSTIKAVSVDGNNLITGALSGISSRTSLTDFDINGLNTVSGDIDDLPLSANLVLLQGNNVVSAYSSPRTWAATMKSLTVYPTSALSSTIIDNLLIDLAASTWVSPKNITLRGPMPVNPSPGYTAYTTLVGAGVTVSIAP